MTGLSTLSINFVGAQYISVGDVAPLKFDTTDEFSISCWLFSKAASTHEAISKFNGTTGYYLRKTTDGKIEWSISNSGGNVTTIRTLIPYCSGATVSTWCHVVVTHTSGMAASNLKIFVNGWEVMTTTISETLSGTIDSTAPFQISGYNGTAGAEWNGNIDEVAIYNSSLSLTEVREIYNDHQPVIHSTTGPIANLVGYWRMGEGATFPTIPDDSGNSNDGTMTSMVAGDLEAVFPGGPLNLNSLFSSIEVGGGGGSEVITNYLMRGIDSAGPHPSYHYWQVSTTPDLLGASAGSLPFGGPLTDIVVIKSY